MSRLLDRVRAYGRVLPRGRRNHTDLFRHLVRRPGLLLAVSTYETALVATGRLDNRLRYLAQLKTSALIGCPF